MEFAKLHALGNDFLIVDIGTPRRFSSALAAYAREICHRRCGVGADGILYYWDDTGSLEADVTARIFNADGSEAEMSGNGVRCLAAHLYRSGRSRSPRVHTPAGIRALSLRGEAGTVYTFEGSMGQPITDPDRIPVRVQAAAEPILDYPIRVGTANVNVTITSMGNPHCSTFWPKLDQALVERLGPALERDRIFPNRTNVEFIEVLDRQRLRVRFWERGVGHTLASGTGSCAAAVAAILHGHTESPVTVETELGSLTVRWEPAGEVFLTGPAEFICRGDYAGRAQLTIDD